MDFDTIKYEVIPMDFFEIAIQTVLAFFTILFITRLLGRQQISQLTLYEYINGITLGSIAATLATDLNQRSFQHFVGLIIFGLLTGVVSFLSLKNRPFRKAVDGEPILAIYQGKLLEKNLKKARYSMDELNELLREKDCFDLAEVHYGVLEINGELSILKQPEKSFVKAEDLNLTPPAQKLQTEIIIGGQIIYENLAKRRMTGKDLIKLLKEKGIKRVEEVMYLTLDAHGKMYVDLFRDNIEETIDISEDNKDI